MLDSLLLYILPIIIGWGLDLLLGDPPFLPHPVVLMGKAVSFFEKRLNKGKHKRFKGAVACTTLIALTIAVLALIIYYTDKLPLIYAILIRSIFVFFFLAGTTLICEVKNVFKAVDISVEDGRKQIARIVGRETDRLTPQEIRTAALETLSENLSDGVIAPLFWLMIGGIPGMAAYKMANTLDSMIGYKTARFKDFGRFAAKTDDILNWLPARLSAILMACVSGKAKAFRFIRKYARCHASPNSGYPESALAGILDAKFGGPHSYFGEIVEKPYIGENPRCLTTQDMHTAIRINRLTEIIMIAVAALSGTLVRWGLVSLLTIIML